MIDIQDQQKLFLAIAKKLLRKIGAYAIGGTAMMLKGIKAQTLDVDIVFMAEEDRELFKAAAFSLGNKPMDSVKIYGQRKDAPIMIEVADAHIDLFTRNVIGVHFSDTMIQRAEQVHQFDKNLSIKVADMHDVIIMKSATDRDKDEEDIVTILEQGTTNWKTLIREAENQVSLGNERAILALGHRLEKISNRELFFIPKEVLNNLYSLLEKQVKSKTKLQGKTKKRA